MWLAPAQVIPCRDVGGVGDERRDDVCASSLSTALVCPASRTTGMYGPDTMRPDAVSAGLHECVAHVCIIMYLACNFTPLG